MDTNETENDNKSWSLFGSSDQSISSEHLPENFEEVSFPCYSESSNRDTSYEVIEDNTPQDNQEAIVYQHEETEQPNPSEQITQRPPPAAEESKKTSNDYIRSPVEEMLNSSEKRQEIKNFESLLGRFDKWLFEKRQKNASQDRSMIRNTEAIDSEFSICKFLVYNKNINAFVLPFSDVYVNIIVTKQAYKNKVQGLCAEFLKETEPQGQIWENNFNNRSHQRKLVFKFPQGTTKFIITVGLDFRLRLSHYITLCTIIDEKFLTIGAFLSHWAYKRKILNDKYLNPYALHFMVVYFLMTQEPSILPRFNEEELDKMNSSKSLFSGSRGHRKSFIIYKPKQSVNESTGNKEGLYKGSGEEVFCKANLEDIVSRFFFMYGHEIPKVKMTLSIKRGYPIDAGKRVTGYSIADPFNPQYDLCKNLNDEKSIGYQLVKSEFERGFTLMSEGKIQEVCQE